MGAVSPKMNNTNCPITAELISDYAAGRLDPEDVRVIEEAIGRDEAIATAVAAARKVNCRMTISLARPVEEGAAITR
jgi:anti-sigma factor RsiW